DPGAGAPHLRLHALRGHQVERPEALLQELDPGGAEAAARPHRPARDPRPVHAADLAERQALREHARRPHPDPHVPRPDLHLPVARAHPGRDPGDTLLSLRGRDRRRDPGVHLPRPVRHLHRLGDRARTLRRNPTVSTLLAATSGDVTKAGKAIGLALGVGLGALGAGVGIGNIFGSMIQSVARQPELRGELQGIQWLGFALTEAVVFYGLLGSILAYVLV